MTKKTTKVLDKQIPVNKEIITDTKQSESKVSPEEIVVSKEIDDTSIEKPKSCSICSYYKEDIASKSKCPFMTYNSFNLHFNQKFPHGKWNIEEDFCSYFKEKENYEKKSE